MHDQNVLTLEMATCLTRKETPNISPTQNQRVRREKRDQVGWEPSLALKACTALSSAAQLAAVSTAGEGSHLPSFTPIKSL